MNVVCDVGRLDWGRRRRCKCCRFLLVIFSFDSSLEEANEENQASLLGNGNEFLGARSITDSLSDV